MPRGIGYHDLTPYLKELLDKVTDLPYEYLSDEIKELIERPDEITLDQLSPELQALVQTANNVGYDNLDPYLQSKIDDIGKISSDTIYISNNNIFKATTEVYEDTYDVGFICGDITEFTMFKDTLNVYLNSVRLAEGVDYVINEDRISIHSLKEKGWTINNGETLNLFEFELYRNSTLEAAGDGVIVNEYIADDTITIDKLSPEVRDMVTNNVNVVKNNIYFGYKYINIDTSIVNFICGEIKSFNKDRDIIEVFLNSERLTRGVHYEVRSDSVTIENLDGYWSATLEEPNFFEIVVEKNVAAEFDIDNKAFIETENIVDESITIEKLDPALLEMIMSYQQIQIKRGYAALTGEITETTYKIGQVPELSASSIISVYVNSVRLIYGLDYTIDLEKETIKFTNQYIGTEEAPVYLEVETVTGAAEKSLIATLEKEVRLLGNQVIELNDKLNMYKSETNSKFAETESKLQELRNYIDEQIAIQSNNLDDHIIDELEFRVDEQVFRVATNNRLDLLENSTEFEIHE